MKDEGGRMKDEERQMSPSAAFHPSSFTLHPSRSAFTLIEMLTTVAALIIVLGLMVSLARYVRDRSAQQLTRDTLRQLERLMGEYVDHNGRLPAVDPILPAELGALALAPPSATTLPAAPD